MDFHTYDLFFVVLPSLRKRKRKKKKKKEKEKEKKTPATPATAYLKRERLQSRRAVQHACVSVSTVVAYGCSTSPASGTHSLPMPFGLLACTLRGST